MAADDRGDGVTRQADRDHRAEPARHHRLARPHRDLPEAEIHAGPLERLLDEVMRADRGAAQRHQHIGAGLPRLPDPRGEVRMVVARDAEVEHAPARLLDQRGEGKGVGRDDLVRSDRLARQHEFVAGGEDRDQRLAAHRQGRVTGGGGEPERGAVEPGAGREQPVPVAEIEPGLAHELALRRALADGDRGRANAVGVLLDQDGVGALGDRGAGEDSDRLSSGQCAGKGTPCGRLADDAEFGALREVVRADRIAVHGRVGEGRLRPQRCNVGSEHAPGTPRQRQGLDGRGAGHAVEQRAQRGGDRRQGHQPCPTGEVSASKTPDLPPDLWVSLIPSIRMPRSAALTMS